ncbi:MAG: divalent-cation tolerance protein CutA [Chloracidobacterium sp.]|nr:divalent-cation tolerance protein CutA [Chloracidobacterium sp.]
MGRKRAVCELNEEDISKVIIVFTTTPDRALANELADRLVRERLAACVQILPQMTSVYFWEGEVRRDEEHLLLIKTTADRYAELEKYIRANHTYDTPEIAAVNVDQVDPKYREWLEGWINR